MKQVVFIIGLLVSWHMHAQTKYLTKTGVVKFEASVPSFEEVAATNQSVTAILNLDTQNFAALAFVKAFRFKNALMEEHFNENYAESDQFPKATFKGVIQGLERELLSENSQQVRVSGMLAFHGVTKEVQVANTYIKQIDDRIFFSGNFTVKVSDFNIKIPKIVQNKLSDTVTLDFSFELVKQ